MNVKKTVRVISNENDYKFEPFYRDCENHHRGGLYKFLYNYNINVEDTSDSMIISRDLANLGFCVILTNQYSDIGYVEIFIPKKISKKQLEYFQNEKLQNELNNHNIILYKCLDNNKIEIINKANAKEAMTIELMNELLNRLETERFKANKPKTRKLINNN